MRTAARPRWSLFIPVFVGLLACDGGTGPDRQPTLSVAQAAPFALVEVRDLAAQYASGDAVTVGGTASILVRDEADEVHRFMVPDLPAGPAEVVIPARGRSREVRLALTVLPRQFAGGTPDAALAEMDRVLDSLQVSVSHAMNIVDPERGGITGRLDAFLAVAQILQQHVDSLPAKDRAAVAGVYSGVADEMRLLTSFVANGVGELGRTPVLGGRAAVTGAIPSATAVVTACEDFNRSVEVFENIVQAIDYVLTAIEVLSWFGGPAGRAGAAAFSMVVGLGLDIGTLIVNSVPKLIDPQGLRLQASPPRIQHMGDEGTMHAWVRRRSAGELADMADLADLLEDYATQRGRIDVSKIAAALGALEHLPQMQAALDYLNQHISDFLNEEIIEPGEVPVTFDGIIFSFGSPSSFWEFVDGPATASRRFRSLGSNSQPVRQYEVEARIGTSNRCKATTQGSDPARGLNGFEISTGAEVRFTGTAEVELAPDAGTSTTIGMHNRGVDTSGALTYRMQHAGGGGYVPPAWLSVSISAAPPLLGPGEQGTMRLSIGVADEAPERSVTVPIAVVDEGQVVDNTTLTVTVRPEPADIVVNRSPSTIRLWDYELEDGDILTVNLNGTPVVSGVTVLNAGASFPIRYRRGRNVLTIRAHNEGPNPPNTPGISFADVVQGASSRTYRLTTGQVVRLVILYDPEARLGAAANLRPGVAPAPVYVSCAEDPGGECGP